MGQRNAGSRQWKGWIFWWAVWGRIQLLWRREFLTASWLSGHSEHELHHAIPCFGFALSHPGKGQDGGNQNGAVWWIWERRIVGYPEEPYGDRHVDPICEQGDGGRSQVSNT